MSNQPTIESRLEACRRPLGRSPVMYQKWRDLLFLHWELEPEVIQNTLPEGLTVDTFNGRAFLGVVPFYMRDIRPRFLPAVPGISNFLETNLRTYVYDQHGRPGVWFYSLDADQWLAVRVARTLFNLPYFDATMRAGSQPDGIDYTVSRKGCDTSFDSHFRYAEGEKLATPDPESLEFFLVERYALFAATRSGTLLTGRVYHTPYPLRSVEAEVKQEGTMALAGFGAPPRPPDHAIMSRGVDVDVFGIERVG